MTKATQARHTRRALRTLRRPQTLPLAALLLALVLPGGCALVPASASSDEAAIRALLERQLAAWNAGDLTGFMGGYLQAPETRFASGDHAGRGWDQALARYRARYPDARAMGRLAFGQVEVEGLGRHHAVAFGRWRLDGPGGSGHGLFTLLLARTVDGWRIVHDHTSAGPARGAPPGTP